MFYIRHVHPYLVCSTGFYGDFKQRIAPEFFEHFVESYRFLAYFRPWRVFFPDFRVYAYGHIYSVGGEFGATVNDREVLFFYCTFFELCGDFPLRGVIFCYDHDAGGISVEAVDDSRPELSESAGEIVAVKGQGVDQRAVGIAACGMDDHISLFVEDDYIVVFVDDIERNFFGENLFRGQFRQCQVYAVVGAELEAGFYGVSVDGDGAGTDDFLDHCPAVIAEPAVEVFIDSPLLDRAADSQC